MTSPISAPLPATFQDIVIPDAKADATYQKTIADLQRTLADYQTQQLLARQQYDTTYNDNKRRLGWNQTTKGFDPNVPGEYSDAVYTNTNDFAGRGMTYSGANAQAQGNIDRDFADRATQMDTGRANDAAAQAQSLSSFKGQETATENAALTDALARIASRYGVGLNEVPQGSTKTINRQVV